MALHFGKPVDLYLCDLKAKLESAVNFAQKHSQQAQNSYATHYNRKSKEKHFVENEQKVVLAPDNRGKLNNHWQGPATIAKVKLPHSYLVDMGDGGAAPPPHDFCTTPLPAFLPVTNTPETGESVKPPY